MKFLSQRPLLARYAKYKKNLIIVDKNRYYSNYGPLYFKLKKKLKRNLNLKIFQFLLLLAVIQHYKLVVI